MIIVNGKRRDGGRGKRPAVYNFSGLGIDTFSETLEDGALTDYIVERDSENRITKIMTDGLHDVDILWEPPPPDDRLRFVAEEAGSTITLKVNGTLTTVPVLEYSLDGTTWTEFSCDNAPVITLANVGDTVWMRGENARFGQSDTKYIRFAMAGKIRAVGNIEYLRSKSGAVTPLVDYCYYSMFYGCTSLTTAPALPATTLEMSCYQRMFYNCTSLTAAPELPATTLANGCYTEMFYNCTSLTAAPELPATTLANYCYSQMFKLSGLVEPPELPALNLTDRCYYLMFEECRNLLYAPELPADTLKESCYQGMFYLCTNLRYIKNNVFSPHNLAKYCCYAMFRASGIQTTVYLPAETLTTGCYMAMFQNCSHISGIKVGFHKWSTSSQSGHEGGTYYWAHSINPVGTFTCPTDLEQTFGDSCIPSGWTVETF